MTPDEVAGLLARTEPFGHLDAATLDVVGGRCQIRTYARGHVVVTEGDAGDAMFVVASGLLKVTTAAEDGGPRLVLVTLRPPDVFGEIAVFDGGERSASVEAAERSTLVLLRRDTLLELVRERPGVAEALLRYLAGMVRRLTRQTTDLAFLDLHGRVAKLLSALAAERGTPGPDGVRLDLPLTQSDLAAMVGGSRQSVNQILRAFERRGWLVLDGRVIVVRRPDELRRRGES